MPRKSLVNKSRLEIALPLTLRLQAELFLQRDPITGKIAFGEWSQYITRLVAEDLNRRAQGENHVSN